MMKEADLITRAKNGDQEAIAALYEETYSKVWYTVRSMIRNEDDSFDIVQDSYIKAFSHLDSFEGEAFTSWIRQIAANTARDWLKKKRPLLFSELGAGEDEDIPAEDFFEDERTENLPEAFLEQEETARLIREILEELPEDQRAAIGMFYYEELSVKEIAAAMNVSESAVKSRLLYGRRKVEKKVRELEKKGTKLYGLSPILFLLWLFRSRKADDSETPDPVLLQRILETASEEEAVSAAVQEAALAESVLTGTASASENAASAAKAAAGAGTAAALGAGSLSAGKIALIAIAAAAVIGGGIFGITKMSQKRNTPATTAEPPVETVSDTEAESTERKTVPVPVTSRTAAETTIEVETTTEEEKTTAEETTTEEENTTEEETTADPQEALDKWKAAEQAAGRTVLVGTVDTITYDEAVKLQGYPDANAADKGQTWVIIRLDSPQLLKITQDVSSWEREYSVLLIWTRWSSGQERGETVLSGSVGEHIICSAGSFNMASDTSVPIGFPWVHGIQLYEADGQ